MKVYMSNIELAKLYNISVQEAAQKRPSLLGRYNSYLNKKFKLRVPRVKSRNSINNILRGDY